MTAHRARTAGICPGCGGGIAVDQAVTSWRGSLTDAHTWCVIKDNELNDDDDDGFGPWHD